MGEAICAAAALVASGDPALVGIVALSLAVSLSAVALATVLGLPLGAALAVARFPGRRPIIVLLNALMGLPPVVVGLVVYLLLSRAGPLGDLGLLFTPGAMVIAQTILILPIIAALCRQAVEDAWREYEEQLRSLGVKGTRGRADRAVGHPLLAPHRGARRTRPRERGGRRGDDRRRQHRRRDARHDHRDRARDLERRPAARARPGRGADRGGARAERRGVTSSRKRRSAATDDACRSGSRRFRSSTSSSRCRSRSRPGRAPSSSARTAPAKAC